MILIVNDDGYSSENLYLLYKYCFSIDKEVKFIVPLEDKSGIGNYSSLNKSFNISKVAGGFVIDGTPVDCVRWGLSNFDVDLVISGVNIGFNIGKETLLSSGTFMGAREGYLNNIKSLSCSFDKFKKLNYELLQSVLDEVLQLDFKLANLNIVSSSIMITELCENMYEYQIKDNVITTNNRKKFVKNTDGDVVFNQNKSSLTILK